MPCYKDLPQKRRPASSPARPRLTRADFFIGMALSFAAHLLVNVVFGHPLSEFTGATVATAMVFGLLSAGLYSAFKQKLRKRKTA